MLSIEDTYFNPSYIGSRQDILNLIPNNVGKVLDVGCSNGTLGEELIRKCGAKVVGIEMDVQMAQVAKKKLEKVIIGNIEEINLEEYFTLNSFDCIIFADILEHLINPWKILKNIVTLLKNDGLVVASIPNVKHYSTITNLLFKGYWPYRERGIYDVNHLRFFTLKNIREIFDDSGLINVKIERNYRIIESPHKLNKLSKYFAFPPFREFITFQYLVVARKN